MLWLDSLREQGQGIEFELLRYALDASQRQVALAALDAAHVGAVDMKHVGERLLAQPLRLAVGPQFAADRAL